MASEIKVDTIVNAGGDNDTGIDLATNDQILLKVANSTKLTMNSTGQTTIVGEGGTTTTSMQQGLAKSWTHFNGDSFGSRDDFNTSSLTDVSTGNYTFAITNNMGNRNYTLTTNGTRANDQHVGCYWYDNLTTQAKMFTMDFTSNSYEDTDTVMAVIHGDLA
jgi:hypothetical protein